MRSKFGRWAVRAGAVAAALAVGAASGVETRGVARASAPVTPPVFTNPRVFTNPFFPFAPGGVKVFRGKDEGERSTNVDLYLAATRDFLVGGQTVTCSTLQETEFEGGELVEISTNWFAQADDGTVYYFGEITDEYEDGAIVGHGGSWLVGGPVGNDPPETATVNAPAVFMPGNPEVGDVFRPEDVPGGPTEIDTVQRVGVKVKTPGGKFAGCLEIGELNPEDGERETKWYAPGVGVVKGKGRGDAFALDSSTYRQD